MAFGTLTMWYNHHLYLVPKLFHFLKRKPISLKQLFCFSHLCSPWQPPICFFSLCFALFWVFYINAIIKYVTLNDRFLILSIMFSRFVHNVAHISISFFLCLNNTPRHVCATFVHSSPMDTPVVLPLGCGEDCCHGCWCMSTCC